MAGNRAQAEEFILSNLNKIIPDTQNVQIYKDLFAKMSDKEFGLFMKSLEDGDSRLAIIVPNLSKEKLYKTIQGAIDTQKYLIPKIEELTVNNASNIFFLTGIGQVYPFLRSHTVLNNLQNSVKDRPTVMFFPGIYDGTSLSLFGKLKDDNYYRAFNLETVNLVK